LEEDVLGEVKAAIVELLEVDPKEITLESRFREDLGADSLDQVEMLMLLEERFDIVVPDEDVLQLTTVGSVVSYISARTGRGTSWRRSNGMIRPGDTAPDEE
jgi:acyl carrier protein